MEDLRPSGIVHEVEAATAIADGLEPQGVRDLGSGEQAVVQLGRDHQLCSLWGHGMEKDKRCPRESWMMAEGWVKEGDEEDVDFRRKRRSPNCFEAARAQREVRASKRKEGSHLANFTLSRVGGLFSSGYNGAVIQNMTSLEYDFYFPF